MAISFDERDMLASKANEAVMAINRIAECLVSIMRVFIESLLVDTLWPEM